MRAVRRLNPLPFLLLLGGALLTLCAWQAGGPTEILGTLPAILLAVALLLAGSRQLRAPPQLV